MSDSDSGTRLETGYGPATPPGDNLCNDFVQETAASFAALARARGDRVERLDGIVTMTDAAMPLPFWNRAVLEQPVGDVDALLASVREFYDGAGHHPFLVDSAWPLPDLGERGFVLMGHPPIMVRPAGASLPPAPPELRILAVTDDATAHDLERTLVDGYPAPALQPFTEVTMMTSSALTASGWHHFVGYVDDRPVAAGSAYAGDQLLRVENIAVLDGVRGRGYGVAITAATIGVDLTKPATLVSSDLGRPIYEKLGFRAVMRCTYWLGMR
ncbi:MAG TPA: GNAT family N-acetyltransferase [Acidimicrobiia bacterium]|nr:GNAT family N-acetyltransferase [Acidimicrobiia bacterium]